jgi:hypothetical protein
VQGRLRNAYLTVTISTRCAHSGKPLQIEVDSQLKYRVQPDAARQVAQPMVFLPQVDWEAFRDPNIIDAY